MLFLYVHLQALKQFPCIIFRLLWHSEHYFQHLRHLHVRKIGKVVNLTSMEHICDTPQGCVWYLKLCFRPYPEN